ncbi:MAG: potassium channel family protein [Actinomycetota bacterium]|nr:potassium channel family protein [Actinomycetota bacterium]
MQDLTQRKPVLRLGLIRIIIRNSGLANAIYFFLATFILCALLIRLFDPSITHFSDALWYCFETITTIGFGDLVISSWIARVATVVLSIVSIFFIAILTGTVVNYCNELMRVHRNESLALFIDKLEHLDKLPPEELAALSERIKGIGKRNRS